MQKFYWSAPGPTPGPAPAPPPSYQTLTLAINSYTGHQHQQGTRPAEVSSEAGQPPPPRRAQEPRQPRVQHNAEIKSPGAKTIHLSSSASPSDYYRIKVNGNKQCIQVNQSYLQDAGAGLHNNTFTNNNNNSSNSSSSNRVVVRLGEVRADPAPPRPAQPSWRYSKTWNENMKGKQRGSVLGREAEIFSHDYENVFADPRRKEPRQTPRSRKKSKHPGGAQLHRWGAAIFR